jgi:hypothetical protein
MAPGFSAINANWAFTFRDRMNYMAPAPGERLGVLMGD